MPGKTYQRSIRLISTPTEDEPGVFSILEGKNTTLYAFNEIPCDIGGRGFIVHRLGIGRVYHTRIGDPKECSCECRGYLRTGYCKHVLGLKALIERELL